MINYSLEVRVQCGDYIELYSSDLVNLIFSGEKIPVFGFVIEQFSEANSVCLARLSFLRKTLSS